MDSSPECGGQMSDTLQDAHNLEGAEQIYKGHAGDTLTQVIFRQCGCLGETYPQDEKFYETSDGFALRHQLPFSIDIVQNRVPASVLFVYPTMPFRPFSVTSSP